MLLLRRANAQPRSGGIFIAWGVSPRTRQTKNTQSREAAADKRVCRRFAAGLYAECPSWGSRPRLCICRASGACRKLSFLSAAESNFCGRDGRTDLWCSCLSRRSRRRSRIPAARAGGAMSLPQLPIHSRPLHAGRVRYKTSGQLCSAAVPAAGSYSAG